METKTRITESKTIMGVRFTKTGWYDEYTGEAAIQYNKGVAAKIVEYIGYFPDKWSLLHFFDMVNDSNFVERNFRGDPYESNMYIKFYNKSGELVTINAPRQGIKGDRNWYLHNENTRKSVTIMVEYLKK